MGVLKHKTVKTSNTERICETIDPYNIMHACSTPRILLEVYCMQLEFLEFKILMTDCLGDCLMEESTWTLSIEVSRCQYVIAAPTVFQYLCGRIGKDI